MSKFMDEFKTFVLRGNVMDLAVGVIIGGAFSAITSSLVEDIISPILGMFGGKNFDELALEVNGAVIGYGKFITAVINFLIMAFIVFLMMKGINGLREKTAKKEEEAPAEPTTKECPFCLSQVPIGAVKCPCCTSDISEDAVAKMKA